MQRATFLGSAVILAVIGFIFSAHSALVVDTHPQVVVAIASPQSSVTAASVTLEIMPNPVMETNSNVFFGTGDGGNGNYAGQTAK
jgi:hypothetical protein